MPTEPLAALLERDIAQVVAKPIIDVACPLLRELVNDGTTVLQRCQLETAGAEVDIHVAPFALYRHILEATDGAEVLFSNACVTPAIAVIRSSFEADLQLEYILADDKEYRQRSLSWLVGGIHDQLRFYGMLDPSSTSGKQFDKAMDQQFPELRRKIAAVEPDAAQRVAELTSLLQEPHLAPIEAEYQKYKPRNWYGLFGGPGNLADLTNLLNRRSEYDILYRLYSRSVHGADFQRYVMPAADGTAAIRPLRASEDFSTLAVMAASFCLHAKRLMLGKFRHGENYATWYLREVREPYNALFLGTGTRTP